MAVGNRQQQNKPKTFDAEEMRPQRIGGRNFNTEEPEKRKLRNPENHPSSERQDQTLLAAK